MRLLITVCMVFWSTTVYAGWDRFDTTEGNTWYVDKSTLKRGKFSTVWVMRNSDVADSNGIRSSKSLWEADCTLGQIRTLNSMGFSRPSGEGPASYTVGASVSSYPPPNSLIERFYNFLCSRK
jgi:hypothetical protein